VDRQVQKARRGAHRLGAFLGGGGTDVGGAVAREPAGDRLDLAPAPGQRAEACAA
jgi:hypothetical protein